jgi:acyl dehydratase
MSFDVGAIGRRSEVVRYEVTEAALSAYAAATDDEPGGPVFAIVPVWDAIAPASRSVASEEARARVVHYEHDIRVHRPLEPGMSVLSEATPVSLLARPNGATLVIKAESRAADGELVNEQYVTEFFRGVEAPTSVGDRAPEHRLDVDGAAPIAELSFPLAQDQTERYAAASGDDFAIHLDDAFAREVGLPGRIVHGLCALAFAGRAVAEASGAGSSAAVERLAVRFSAPLFPGETLTTRVWEVDGGYGFEAVSDSGAVVLKDGRAELR